MGRRLRASRRPTRRLLAVHRYYWPDSPPYATILREIVKRWVGMGADVDVLAGQPSYKSADAEPMPSRQVLDGTQVRRLNLPHEAGRPLIRILNTARLAAAIFRRAASGKYDTVMVSTVPPVIPGVAARLGTRISGARFIYHCMDLHPEIGRLSGEFANPMIYRALLRLDAANCAAADPVVVLSPDMAESVLDRPGCSNANIMVINNFALPDESPQNESVPSPLPPSTARLRLLFAGNLGRFQGLDVAISAIHILADRGQADIELVLMGTGNEAANLRAQATAGPGAHQVIFVDQQPVSAARAAMRDVDCGLVSLTPEIYRYAYPSKTITYLIEGCPVVAMVESESSLAQDIVGAGLGWVTPIGDPIALADLLQTIASEPRPVRRSMSQRIRTTAAERFGTEKVLAEWGRLIEPRPLIPTEEHNAR